MKISKLFHYLYAAIMFLPLLLIPVFMIYSHRHTMTEQTTVDIQYKYQSNEVSNTEDLVADNIYYLSNFYINGSIQTQLSDLQIYFLQVQDFEYNLSNIELDSLYYGDVLNGFDLFVEFDNGISGGLYAYFGNLEADFIFSTESEYITFSDCIVSINDVFIENFKDFCNEQQILPQYTDYNVIESVDVQDTNSSVMNVFMDNFNNAINQYFNMRNVFNLNQLYNWLNVNIFNGVSAVSFNILFNLFAYWLFVSLLWLMFDCFMYIPLIMHNAIDKARLE